MSFGGLGGDSLGVGGGCSIYGGGSDSSDGPHPDGPHPDGPHPDGPHPGPVQDGKPPRFLRPLVV